MYSMVLMAALTTGSGMPDFNPWGGWGGNAPGWGWGGYGSGWGASGWGWGSYDSSWGGWGDYGLGSADWRYGGYPQLGFGSGYSPMAASWGQGWGTPGYSGGPSFNPDATQSFYYNPGWSRPPEANPASQARLVVHLPPQARLTIDDYPTMSRRETRVFHTPPLEPGKTYTYTLRAELNRDGRFVRTTKTVEVKAGELSEVTLRFGNVTSEELGEPTEKETPSRR